MTRAKWVFAAAFLIWPLWLIVEVALTGNRATTALCVRLSIVAALSIVCLVWAFSEIAIAKGHSAWNGLWALIPTAGWRHVLNLPDRPSSKPDAVAPTSSSPTGKEAEASLCRMPVPRQSLPVGMWQFLLARPSVYLPIGFILAPAGLWAGVLFAPAGPHPAPSTASIVLITTCVSGSGFILLFLSLRSWIGFFRQAPFVPAVVSHIGTFDVGGPVWVSFTTQTAPNYTHRQKIARSRARTFVLNEHVMIFAELSRFGLKAAYMPDMSSNPGQ